jgi:ParB-like chromosome segregation protein Spo0J
MSETSTAVVVDLPIEDVYPHPKHYRAVAKTAVDTLAESMKVVGQLEPIIAVQDGEMYWIYAGHHRHAALKTLGAQTISTRVVSSWSEAAALSAMVASNLHAQESDLEKSRGVQLLLNVGVKPLDVAAISGEKQDRISRVSRAMKVLGDPVAAEDMTIDRFIAIEEFADDADAVTKLRDCKKSEWATLAAKLMKERKLALAIAEAEETVTGSGCELVGVDDPTPADVAWIGLSPSKPEGATHARLRIYDWNGTCEIGWYRPRTESELETNADSSAAKEAEEAARAELQALSTRRLEFIRSYLGSPFGSAQSALRDYAEEAWGDGFDASVNSLDDTSLVDVAGFTPRIHAAILAGVEEGAKILLTAISPHGYSRDYYMSHHAKSTMAYFRALTASGYEPTATEIGLTDQIAAALKSEAGDPDE